MVERYCFSRLFSAAALAVAFASFARADADIQLRGRFTADREYEVTSDTKIILNGVEFVDCGLKLRGDRTFTLVLAEGTQNSFRMTGENHLDDKDWKAGECIKATKQSNVVIDGKGSLELLSEKRITDKKMRSGVLVCNDLTVRDGDVRVTFDNNKSDTSCIFLKGNYLQTGGKVKLDLHKKNCTNELHGVTFDTAETTFTLEGGEFNAEIAGAKSRAVSLKKSGRAFFKGGTVRAEFEGPEGRFVSGGALVEFSGGSYEFATNVTAKMTAAYFPTNLSAVKAQNAIRITGGKFRADLPLEGCEIFANDSTDGTDITIAGGELDLVAGDDCVNANNDILVSGGRISATSVFDDVFDANNDLTITGGDIRAWATAPGAHAFDVNSKRKRTFRISGGIVVGTDGLGAIMIGERSDEVGKADFVQPTYYGTVSTSEYLGKHIVLEGKTNGAPFTLKMALPKFAEPGDFNLLASVPGRPASKPEPQGAVEGEASFEAAELTAAEASVLKVEVSGGRMARASSVQVRATYLTASAADFDLKGVKVDGAAVRDFKFPFRLEWAAGEVGTKTIEIPVVDEATVEADERLYLELLNPENLAMGGISCCAVTIRDPKYGALKQKVAGGTATDEEKRAVEKADAVFAGKVQVCGRATDATCGKVTGSALVAKGKKATLKATANKGYAFAGWYASDRAFGGSALPTGEPVSRQASLAVSTSDDVEYMARFVTTAEDKGSIKLNVNGFDFAGAGSSQPTNVMAGVYLVWPVAARALSEPTVKVSGLPSGLKFTAKNILKKGSKTEVAVPANTIYGAPTAASKANSKTGAVTPSKVKVTVTTAGKSKAEYAIDLTVDPLPAWAVGEFSGLALSGGEGLCGSASITVSAAGKVSGKAIVNGTSGTFAAASYDIQSRTDGTPNLVIVAEGKVGKAKAEARLSVSPESAVGRFDGAEMSLYRNVWKDKGAAPVPERFQGLYTVKLGAGERGTGYLSLKVDKKGAVKVAGKAPDGTALSTRATLIHDAAGVYFADVFAAPTAYKGGSVAGRLAVGETREVSSPYGLSWTSLNPVSTADASAGGFDREFSVDGAWYSKTEPLDAHYRTLAFKAPNRGVDQACWGALSISVDPTGKKFVVDQKKTTPAQDEATKQWRYAGANDAALALSFAQATGIWKGSFLWWNDAPKHVSTKVSFEGVLVQGEDLDGFGTFDASSSYVPVDKRGVPQDEKTYKYKESVPVSFVSDGD